MRAVRKLHIQPLDIDKRSEVKKKNMNEAATVVLSIKPHWWELIKSGKKTVEFRSTKPRVAENLKVYIYATSPTRKVVGEFYCPFIGSSEFTNSDTATNERILEGTCLSEEEAMNYFRLPRKIGIGSKPRNKSCFLWKIKGLVVYDKPRELKDFISYTPQSWGYVRD